MENLESLRRLSDEELLGRMHNPDAVSVAPLVGKERDMVIRAFTERPFFSGEPIITVTREASGSLRISKISQPSITSSETIQ